MALTTEHDPDKNQPRETLRTVEPRGSRSLCPGAWPHLPALGTPRILVLKGPAAGVGFSCSCDGLLLAMPISSRLSACTPRGPARSKGDKELILGPPSDAGGWDWGIKALGPGPPAVHFWKAFCTRPRAEQEGAPAATSVAPLHIGSSCLQAHCGLLRTSAQCTTAP